MAEKISSVLQSLSDYGLGESDIEDSDNENEETTASIPTVNSAPFVAAASRVVTTSKANLDRLSIDVLAQV